jgi:hypothetical protein
MSAGAAEGRARLLSGRWVFRRPSVLGGIPAPRVMSKEQQLRAERDSLPRSERGSKGVRR